MTRPKQTPEQTAKILSKLTGMPLPRVAQLMQKFPIDTAATKLADEIEKTLRADAAKRAAARLAEAKAKIDKEEQAKYKQTREALADALPFFKK